MLRGIAVAACFASACAAHPTAEPRLPAPARDPALALSTLVASEPPAAVTARRARRIGRLSPPFSAAAPARNALARAPLDLGDRDLASR